MSPTADLRSCTGGATHDEPTVTVANVATDSGTRMKRTLRRCRKEDNLVYHNPPTPSLASPVALGETSPTLNRKSSSASIDTIRPLRSVRQRLVSSEGCPASRKTTSQHATKSSTASPSSTKSPSRNSGTRRLQRSISFRVETGAETNIANITSRIIERLGTFWSASDDVGDLEHDLQTTADDTYGKYALEDLHMKVRCYERHVTTWDDHDDAFFVFPAQLLITCTSQCDFNPLVGPEVTLVDLVCSTIAIDGPYKFRRQISFRTFYDGAKVRYVDDTPTSDVSRGIHTEQVSWCSTMDGDGTFGWYLRFWIPIPFALFQKAETRTFKIDAKVHVNGDEGQEGYLTASDDFTLSRLLRGVAM
ncbi:hypothetical protein DFH29DRAFT_949308 [Suillus ampliporus]|nr:hypothetical protein DFH29DRAFT_949308 [Suillus ampliporus]